jgi:type I restriction enzyme M protein
VVVDPACGTGGFLIASLYRKMGGRQLTHTQVKALVKNHLWGFESEPTTAALCVANMILRGDGTTGIVKGDCFTDPKYPVGKADIALANPPFPHKKGDDQPEKFVDRALDALRVRGTAAIVVPASMLVKSGLKQEWRKLLLKKHTLRAVIKLPDELFQPYAAAYTSIAIFSKGVPHNPSEKVFWARIENDGFRLKKNVRIERLGEQLSDTLEAFRNRTELPGWRSWRKITHGYDWSSGEYIESAIANDIDIRRTVGEMMRSDIALHSQFADRMAMFYRRINAKSIKSRSYAEIARGRQFSLSDSPQLLGHYFYISYGQRELHSKEWLDSGDALVISSSGEYNGSYGFFNYTNLISPPFATIPSTGTIGAGFVQRLPCGVTDDCLILLPKENVPVEMLYTAAAVVRLERWRFSYGRKITPQRIANFKIPKDAALLRWIARRMVEVGELGEQVINVMGDEDEVKQEIVTLIKRWDKDRPKGANIERMLSHPIYQSVIACGTSAIPALIAALKKRPAHWFAALHAITGANPVPAKDEGNISRMADAWISWAELQGYTA